MGFISNQWLNRGEGHRNRRYTPVPIRIVTTPCGDAWSKRNETVAEITAWRANSQYQSLHLSQSEVEQAVHVFLALCSDHARNQIALGVLSGMTDSELLKTLAQDLKLRTRR